MHRHAYDEVKLKRKSEIAGNKRVLCGLLEEVAIINMNSLFIERFHLEETSDVGRSGKV